MFDQMYFINKLPEGFVYLSDVDNSIKQDVRYATNNNFTGKVVPGYRKETVILTQKSAEALSKVQKSLAQYGFGLQVFDGYRPMQAVESFVQWAGAEDDIELKKKYYPDIDKKDLLGKYILEKSEHNLGRAVDLTIIDLKSGKELDMGTGFDFFGPQSNTDFADLSEDIKSNRAMLKFAMEANGFESYQDEWWHYQLSDNEAQNSEEKFNFPVK